MLDKTYLKISSGPFENILGLFEIKLGYFKIVFGLFENYFTGFPQPGKVMENGFCFPGLEKSWNLLNMTKVMEKSWNFE